MANCAVFGADWGQIRSPDFENGTPDFAFPRARSFGGLGETALPSFPSRARARVPYYRGRPRHGDTEKRISSEYRSSLHSFKAFFTFAGMDALFYNFHPVEGVRFVLILPV